MPAKGDEEVLSNLAHDMGRENGPPKGMWACVDLVWATEWLLLATKQELASSGFFPNIDRPYGSA